jgi:hypothetical protein
MESLLIMNKVTQGISFWLNYIILKPIYFISDYIFVLKLYTGFLKPGEIISTIKKAWVVASPKIQFLPINEVLIELVLLSNCD